MSVANWRTETNAGEYFGHEKKKLEMADRRPVIRKASDLVGPGIGVSATRITDFNDLLAVCNGFFSAAPGASNAPNPTDAFIGFVVMDAELGGEQIFRSLDTGEEFVRVVLRNPADPSFLSWGPWV